MLLRSKSLIQPLLTKAPNLKYSNRRSSGFKNEAEQAYQVYANSAAWYDRLIDLNSFWQQNYWKGMLVKKIALGKGERLIDAAGGQGAISIRCLKYIQDNKIEGCQLSVCDVNKAMMEQGQKVLKALNYPSNSIQWVQGDAQKLPFPNESFNVYVMSFGFRGISVQKTFEEAYRVLKPGSRVYCLEIQRSDNFLVDCVHWFAYQHVIQKISYLIFRTREPSEYFVEMYSKIPKKEKIKTIMENAGFSEVEYTSLSLGTATIVWGRKK